MTQTVCDRCGKVITGDSYLISTRGVEHITRKFLRTDIDSVYSYDLCKDCIQEVVNCLKRKDDLVEKVLRDRIL